MPGTTALRAALTANAAIRRITEIEQYEAMVSSTMEVQRVFETTIAHWYARGLISRHRIDINDERDTAVLRLWVRSTHTVVSHVVSHELTEHELRMGGVQAMRDWLEVVEHSIRRACRMRDETIERSAAPSMRIGDDDQVRFDQIYGLAITRPGAIFWSDGGARVPSADWLESEAKGVAAAAKAAELFKKTAGAAAFELLETGKALPLKGSLGGRYEMHRRASFCITRVTDGAQMCAVVPGVPLYDHLLGIKLVIETDEERFLKTANVVGGGRDSQHTPWQYAPRAMPVEAFGAVGDGRTDDSHALQAAAWHFP